MSKAEERACQYTGYCRNQSYKDYLNGYHQAEKDLELTWEDIREIIDISFEKATGLQRKPNIYKEQYYQEVLKRFNYQRRK